MKTHIQFQKNVFLGILMALVLFCLIFYSIVVSDLPLKLIEESRLKSVWNYNLGSNNGKLCQLNKKPVKIKFEGQVDDKVTVKFSDPLKYQGPIVEGWGPNISRNVSLYMKPDENTVLLEPTNLGFDSNWCANTRLIIFQHSRPSSFANRLDNRRTWMNYMRENSDIKAIFVVGLPSGEKADIIQRRIEHEHKLYGDILQVDYIEHANNNTLKTLQTFKYLLNIDWNNKFPEFVMKTDDDVYINLPLLSSILFNGTTPNEEKDTEPLLQGYLFVTAPMLVEPDKMNNTFTDYLICPPYMFQGEVYPIFTSGTGYVFSWSILSCLYQESYNLPYFFIEDVFVGGFAADRCYLKKKDLRGYSPLGKEPEKAEYDTDLLVHYVNHDNKHNIHRLITAGHNKALEV